MTVSRRLGTRLLDLRYLVLLAWSIPWLLQGWAMREPHEDWFFVEIGARTLMRHHLTMASGPALHLYVTNPEVQMGPPALLVAGPFQWLPEQLGLHLLALLLSLLLLPCLWCLERASATSFGDGPALRLRVLLAGVVVVPVWTYEVQAWGHVDDVVGLLAMAVTCLLVGKGRHEAVAGLVLGIGAASKPWVVLLLPLLLTYPRPQVPRALLGFVVGALVWWVPFVLAAPDTVHALGALQLPMVHEPTWRLIGLHGGRAPGWIRPLQLLGGLVLSTVVVRRGGWAAVPVIALAWRVTSDPYDWPYYVMGPLLGAALWDLTRRGTRWWSSIPWATVSTVVTEVVVERELHEAAAAVRLAWLITLTSCVLVISARGSRRKPQGHVDAHPPLRTADAPPATPELVSSEAGPSGHLSWMTAGGYSDRT